MMSRYDSKGQITFCTIAEENKKKQLRQSFGGHFRSWNKKENPPPLIPYDNFPLLHHP